MGGLPAWWTDEHECLHDEEVCLASLGGLFFLLPPLHLLARCPLLQHLEGILLPDVAAFLQEYVAEHFEPPDIRAVLCPGTVAVLLNKTRRMGGDPNRFLSSSAYDALKAGAPLTCLLYKSNLINILCGGQCSEDFWPLI